MEPEKSRFLIIVLHSRLLRNLRVSLRIQDLSLIHICVVGAEYVKEGQTIIDVGINVNAEGKLCGDVDYAAVEPIVDAITPVPGGVGSVTTSVLVGHVVEAAMRKVNA